MPLNGSELMHCRRIALVENSVEVNGVGVTGGRGERDVCVRLEGGEE